MFEIVFMVKTAQEATQMFAVNVYERLKVQAKIRRPAEHMASDQSLFFLSLHMAGFPI